MIFSKMAVRSRGFIRFKFSFRERIAFFTGGLVLYILGYHVRNR